MSYASIPCLLDHLARQMQCGDLPSLVEASLAYYTQHQQGPLDSAAFGAQLAQTISREQEGAFAPVCDFIDVVERTCGAAMQSRLTTIAQEYLERTQYLHPFLHCFGKACVRLLHLSGRTQLFNCLRDGLVFWPSQDILLARYPQGHIGFVLYSRLHVEHDLPARIFQRAVAGDFAEVSMDSSKSLLVDVGLYGTILSRMLDQHLCPHPIGVLFFASRSLFITGWYDRRIKGALMESDRQVDLQDVIRLADTVESLLKPFVLVPTCPSWEITLTDPVSFVCTTAFLWVQREFSRHQEQQRAIRPLELSLEAVKASRTSWFIKNFVPQWEEAEAFLKSWHHGPLFPMDWLGGLSL